MTTSVSWRDCERHPLSAEYPDIAGPEWEQFVANLRKYGNVTNRQITVYEDKILDGWQFYRACVEAELELRFTTLPKGVDPAVFVATVNDTRRHETPETIALRVSKRRERVAVAHADGESTRAIAKREGVSQATVQNDLKAATEQGCSVQPADGKVVGRDGKKRPASMPTQPPAIPAEANPSSAAVGQGSDSPTKTKRRNRGSKNKSRSSKPTYDDRIIADLIRQLESAFQERTAAVGPSPDQTDCLNAMQTLVHKWKHLCGVPADASPVPACMSAAPARQDAVTGKRP